MGIHSLIVALRTEKEVKSIVAKERKFRSTKREELIVYPCMRAATTTGERKPNPTKENLLIEILKIVCRNEP